MAGDVDTIREFLVKLGFAIDDSGQKRFAAGVEAATWKVIQLGTAIATTAGAVVAGVAKIADQMESLYFASQRTGAAVANIQALGFAAGQMGSSAEAARGSLESLARFMRNSPGAEGLIHSIGVQTREANGSLRDTTEIIDDLGKRFADMPYYRANAYAQALGIDEKTLMAMREGMGEFGDEYRAMLATAGMDSQAAAKSSHEFMNEVRSLGAAFVILGQKVATTLTGKLSGDLRRFRDGIVDNFGRIAGIVEKVANGVLMMADVISTLAIRGMQAIGAVIDWFSGLDRGAKILIETVGGLYVAWRLLSAGFLASPIGIIVALGVALLGLYDDYKVWKEGGQSLIDWGAVEPAIKAAAEGIQWFGKALSQVFDFTVSAAQSFWQTLVSAFRNNTGYLRTILEALFILPEALIHHWDLVSLFFARLWGDIKGVFGEAWAFISPIVDKLKVAVDWIANSWLGRRISAAATSVSSSVRGVMDTVADVLDQEWGYTGGGSSGNSREPRGIRNNNPGNLNYVGQAGATREAGPNGRFAVFQTAEEGLQALAHQLRLYARRGINSVRAIISKFAPASENDTQGYIASVSRRMGVDAGAALDLNDPRVTQGLMDAIIRVENGRNPYSTEQIAAASAVRVGGAPAQGGAPVSLNQTTNINVTGSGDPMATAHATAAAQDGVNQRIVRNMRASVQ
ncbi:hypothetical protein ACI2VH_02955 [Ralstonia nicotianae]